MIRKIPNYLLGWGIVLLLPAIIAFGAVADEEYCDRIFISGGSIGLSSNEISLVCGNRHREAWDNVTDNQALFHLKVFLQERAYYHIKTEKKGNRLWVFLGERSYVQSWNVVGAPDSFKSEKFRHILEEPITPKLLDTVTERVMHELGTLGYGCPKVESEFTLSTGVLTTTIQSGPAQNWVRLQSDRVEGLHEDTLRRFDAFVMNSLFNIDSLQLTENRIAGDRILQNSHFRVECLSDGIALTQRNIAGPPRLLTFGFGINTETWLTGRAGWKHSRLGRLGSSLELALMGSFNLQEFQAKSDWYFSPSFNRFHFRPALSVKREKEKEYERYTGQVGFAPATSWDGTQLGLKAHLGPNLTFLRTTVGSGPEQLTFLAFDSQVLLRSHLFELLMTTPREGYEVELRTLSTFRSVLSSLDAHRFDLRFTFLHNLLHFDPPFLVLGLRGGISTTFTPEPLENSSGLPSHFRHFLGGSKDLRGFGRLSLPGAQGALTALYTSFETRFPDLLPLSLEPLLFIDMGMLGSRPMQWDSTVFWSPGFGLRLNSPIGVFRTTLASGQVSGSKVDEREGWRFYLSFGEEF